MTRCKTSEHRVTFLFIFRSGMAVAHSPTVTKIMGGMKVKTFRISNLLFIFLSAVASVLTIDVHPARAIASDPCGLSSGSYVVANGDSCTVDLTQSNVDFFDNNILVRLLITNPSSGNTTIQLALESAPNGLTLLGFDRFGLNDAFILTYPTGWDACGGQGQISAFGKFDACANEPGGEDLSPLFVLNGDVGSFAANVPEGTHFASHLRFGTNPASTCSAFVGDSNVSTNPLGQGECSAGTTATTATTVPEPSTMLLLGVGLLAMAIRGRRTGMLN